MSIKAKLIVIQAVIWAMLALLAGFMVWNTIQISREARSLGPAIGTLQHVKSIRTQFHRQVNALVRYLTLGDRTAREYFFWYAERLQNDLAQFLQKNRTRPVQRDGSSTREVFDDPGDILAGYTRFLALAERVFHLKETGRTEAAAALMETEVETLLDDVLYRKMEGAIAVEHKNITRVYESILGHLGALPWVGRESRRQVAIAETAGSFFLAVDKADRALHRQLNELLDRFIAEEKNHEEFVRYGIEAANAFDEWAGVIREQAALGLPGAERNRITRETIRTAYAELLARTTKAVSLRDAGRRGAAFTFLENNILFVADSVLFSTLDSLGDEAREEIDRAHRKLIDAAFRAVLLAVLLSGILAAAVFAVSHRVIREMIASLDGLRQGTEIIRSGNLDHRIEARASDEFGKLATSFNRMAAAVQERNDELASLIYSISHDLRSPLVNINGFSAELSRVVREADALIKRGEDRPAGGDGTRLRELLENEVPAALGFITDSIDRMTKLLNAVLTLSHQLRKKLSPERIDLNQLVREVLRSFDQEIRERGVDVIMGDLPPVKADRKAMEQILRHLLKNAVQYLEPGRPARVGIYAEQQDGEDRICVQDSGRGIAAEDLPRIFGVFRRVGRQDVPGEGMGLVYAKTLVQRHGGRIWCESEPGVGTVFRFTISDTPEATVARAGSAAQQGVPSLPGAEGSGLPLAEINARLQQEIIERKRTEDILRTERGMFIGGPIVVFKWKAAEGWPVEYVSPNVLPQLGYQPEDLTSGAVSYAAIIHPGDRDRVGSEVDAYSRLGAPSFEQEYRMIRADGQERWVYDFTVVVRDSGGVITHYYGYVLDITDRKRAEQGMLESEKRYRMLFESAGDAIFILEAEGERQGTIVELNKTAADMHGYRTEELIGKHIRELDAPDSAESASDRIRRILEGEWIQAEINHRRKDGTVFPVEISAGLLDLGRHKYVLALDRDITDRKRTEDTLQRYTGELRAANEELKSFAYIVSHDLRAPLVSIEGFSAELKNAGKDIDALIERYRSAMTGEDRKQFELLQKDIRESLAFIASSVRRMDSLITAVLTLSRIGRRELTAEPVDMAALTRSVVDSLAHQIEQRRVSVKLAALPTITADKTAMEQIMGNLVDNALKYLDPERAGELEITAEKGPGETTFRIRDNGRGIAKDDIPKAFELFQRLGSCDVPGEGMGLAYVRTLVRRHNGRIWCESEPGKGSTFSFTIPHGAGENCSGPGEGE